MGGKGLKGQFFPDVYLNIYRITALGRSLVGSCPIRQVVTTTIQHEPSSKICWEVMIRFFNRIIIYQCVFGSKFHRHVGGIFPTFSIILKLSW